MKMLNFLTAVAFTAVASTAYAAVPENLVLTEWNCVDDAELLINNGSDPEFGQHVGNGGNWFELYVVKSGGLDVRGWLFEWRNDDTENNSGWVKILPNASASSLASLPQHTILTLMEHEEGTEDFGQGAWGDSSPQINGSHTHLLISDNANVTHSSFFKVDNDNWEMRILRPRVGSETPFVTVAGAEYVVVQNWVGEDVPPGWAPGTSAINSQEVGFLTVNPVAASSTNGEYEDNNNSTFGSH